jgi:predicted secreted Zn-dependent protease
MAGAVGRIATLRERYARLAESVAYYEARAAEQAVQLSKLRTPGDYEDMHDREEEQEQDEMEIYTEEDMRREEVEIKGLEQRKKTLEERVSAMEKDLSYR